LDRRPEKTDHFKIISKEKHMPVLKGMGRACGMNERQKNCVQGFGGAIRGQ
jgi:hypothetical protein